MTMWFIEDTGFDLVLRPFDEENNFPGSDEQQAIIEDLEEPRVDCKEVDVFFNTVHHDWSFRDYSRE